MEKAYVVLGINDGADADEIKTAYRNKKRLYDPERFVQGSQEWRFACAKYAALDEAYRYAIAAAGSAERDRPAGDDDTDGDELESGSHIVKEIAVLLAVFPLAFYAMQYAAPTVFSDIHRSVRFYDAGALFLTYCFPLFVRFVLLKRPVRNFAAGLFLFPSSLLSADLLLSALLSFLRGHGFVYVPVIYFTGWGVFLAVSANCAILTLPNRPEPRKRAPFLRRAAAYTLTLALSAALSLSLSVWVNNGVTGPLEGLKENAAVIQDAAPEQNWQTLELQDAGVIEIPALWHAESGGEYTRVQGGTVQHIREALTAHLGGKLEEGLDFTLELIVYWWTRADGSPLPPPDGIADMLHEHQLESLRQKFPDAALLAPLGQPPRMAVTLEAYVPGQVVRFKNIVFQHGERIYSLVVGYPAHEEESRQAELDEILRRWRPEP